MEENNNQSTVPDNNPPPAPQPLPETNNPPTPAQNRTIITILLLVFIYPIGLIFMWMWMKWPTWVKVVLSVLVVVPFIIGMFLAITLIAINPQKQFSEANNTKRSSDVNAILNSIGQYAADNNNVYPADIPKDSTNNVSSIEANVCSILVPTYIAALPVDPLVNEGKPITDCSAPYDTGYTILLGENGSVTVSAPKAELDRSISVSR